MPREHSVHHLVLGLLLAPPAHEVGRGRGRLRLPLCWVVCSSQSAMGASAAASSWNCSAVDGRGRRPGGVKAPRVHTRPMRGRPSGTGVVEQATRPHPASEQRPTLAITANDDTLRRHIEPMRGDGVKALTSMVACDDVTCARLYKKAAVHAKNAKAQRAGEEQI